MLADIEDKEKTKLTKMRKRRSKSKLNRNLSLEKSTDKITHPRIINELKRDVQICLYQRLRESRFDPSGKLCLQTNPSWLMKRTKSALDSQQRCKTGPIIMSAINQRQRSMESFKRNEIKRLTADVQTILTGPVMKNFYSQSKK
ncbi:unnamed protein product [Adineta steineri]|uniref:Uncharacterized protein n=1 Tax=Adineta steineri TaxID=433720 RepID=A0A813V6Z1_9BILA|nr:unnamed protein product [Adineta steineri]CAF1216939.1 unnamed protein product [Adineta steineri]